MLRLCPSVTLAIGEAEFEVNIADNPGGDDQCSLPAGLAPKIRAAFPTRAGMLCVLVVDDALDVRAADAAFWRTNVAHGTVAPTPACSILMQLESSSRDWSAPDRGECAAVSQLREACSSSRTQAFP